MIKSSGCSARKTQNIFISYLPTFQSVTKRKKVLGTITDDSVASIEPLQHELLHSGTRVLLRRGLLRKHIKCRERQFLHLKTESFSHLRNSYKEHWGSRFASQISASSAMTDQVQTSLKQAPASVGRKRFPNSRSSVAYLREKQTYPIMSPDAFNK